MAQGLLGDFQPQGVGYGNSLLEEPVQYDTATGLGGVSQSVYNTLIDPAYRALIDAGNVMGDIRANRPIPMSRLQDVAQRATTDLTASSLIAGLPSRMAAAEAGQAMLGAGGGSVPKPSAIKDPMIVMHNINELPLQRAYERGGIPVPSLAVAKVDEPLLGFGELSLIGDPSMAKPSAKNPVYKTDAYTVRQPRTEIIPNKESISFSAKIYTDPIKGMRYIDPTDVAEDLFNQDFYGAGSVALKAAFLKERGLLPPLENFKDEYAFNSFVRSKTDEQYGYNNWFLEQSEKLKSAGGAAEERIFLGFTPSGNRRYTSATLANLVKEMKGKGAGAEGMKGTVSSLRGTIAEKFKTEKEVKESRGLLGKDENFEELHADASNIYYDVLERITQQTGFERDGAEDILEYMIIGGDRQLRDFADEPSKKIDFNTAEDIADLAKLLRSLPTEYFEVKPQRGVGLGEFKGAIVPSNVEQSTLDALQRSGITNIKKYNTQEERAKLVKEFGDQFFTLPSTPVPMSGLLGEEKMTGDEMLRAGII